MSQSTAIPRSALENRVVRYEDLRPCYDAFIDTRTPGSDQKENFTIIGPGVSENPNQFVHIAEPHGFNIGGARQPPHCTNSQHSHDTVEVFYVHSGEWRFDLGEHGEDAQTILRPGDLISIPTKVFRGFTNVGQSEGFLWAVLGGDDPGHVLWAPQVFKLAEQYGLVLLEDGMLIDTKAGQSVPDGKKPMPRTTRDQVDALQVFDKEELEACVARRQGDGPKGELDSLAGVTETVLVGSGRMNWPHGFMVSEINLDVDGVLPPFCLQTTDVYFIQEGTLILSVDGEEVVLHQGDTVTVPPNGYRQFKNLSPTQATLIVVRGGDEQAVFTWA